MGSCVWIMNESMFVKEEARNDRPRRGRKPRMLGKGGRRECKVFAGICWWNLVLVKDASNLPRVSSRQQRFRGCEGRVGKVRKRRDSSRGHGCVENRLEACVGESALLDGLKRDGWRNQLLGSFGSCV